VQEGHLICRLGYCRVAQSIGLVNTGPEQVSEPKEVGYLTQRTSTETLVGKAKGFSLVKSQNPQNPEAGAELSPRSQAPPGAPPVPVAGVVAALVALVRAQTNASNGG
jgi:hypothetical protein